MKSKSDIETAILYLLGHMVGITEIHARGFKPKNRAEYNVNAYVASRAVKPYFRERTKFFWACIASFIFLLISMNPLIQWLIKDDGRMETVGVVSIIIGIAAGFFAWYSFNEAKSYKVTADTIHLAKRFAEFMKGVPKDFVPTVIIEVFKDIPPGDETETCIKIKGWETNQYFEPVNTIAWSCIERKAMQLASAEHLGVMKAVNHIKGELEKLFETFEMIYVWQRPDTNARSLLHLWATDMVKKGKHDAHYEDGSTARRAYVSPQPPVNPKAAVRVKPVT